MLKEANIGLAAMSLSDIVRTYVDSVEMGAVLCKVLAQALVNLVDVRTSRVAQRHAALVGHDDNYASYLVEPGNRLLDAGKDPELLPTGDILAFRRL